jgi:hypothetical protein
MTLIYTPSYSQRKEEIISESPRFVQYFNDIELKISESPYEAREEEVLHQGRRIHVYKRHMKTVFFSGMLPDYYLYLTVLYLITNDNRILMHSVFLHDFPN